MKSFWKQVGKEKKKKKNFYCKLYPFIFFSNVSKVGLKRENIW